MKAQLILLDNPVIVTDEEIKEGDSWIYINPKEWDTPQDYTITKNNLGREWFEKLWDKENYKKVIDKPIDYNGIDFGIVDVEKLAKDEVGGAIENDIDNIYCNGFIEGFKASQQLNEKKFSENDMMDAIEYGFKYFRDSQNNGIDVPKGNKLQWLLNRKYTTKTFEVEIEETPTNIKIIKKL